MTYEEKARIKKRKAYFNTAAALVNMVSFAKGKKDPEEVTKLNGKLDASEEDVKAFYDKIISTRNDQDAQDELTSKFESTIQQTNEHDIPPVETGIYPTNREFFDDALLITYLVDSGSDLGHLKQVEKPARALVALGVVDPDLENDSRGWELENENRYVPAKVLAYS